MRLAQRLSRKLHGSADRGLCPDGPGPCVLRRAAGWRGRGVGGVEGLLFDRDPAVRFGHIENHILN